MKKRDIKALTECYIPGHRQNLAELFSLMPKQIDVSALKYEVVYLDNEQAVVSVKGKKVRVGGKKRDIYEKMKLKKVRGYWYLDNF